MPWNYFAIGAQTNRVGSIMLRPSQRRSFYVVISRTGNDQDCWWWEIRRKRRPMGVRLKGDGFRSYREAQLAGKQALEEFLNGLAMDAGSKISFLNPVAGTEIAAVRHRALLRTRVPVTFIVHGSRGEELTTTIRLSVVVAIAKGRALAEEGWQVFITGPDGIRYHPSEFDKLLSLDPAVRSRSH